MRSRHITKYKKTSQTSKHFFPGLEIITTENIVHYIIPVINVFAMKHIENYINGDNFKNIQLYINFATKYHASKPFIWYYDKLIKLYVISRALYIGQLYNKITQHESVSLYYYDNMHKVIT